MRAVLWICFTMSGAAALALETLWMRSACLLLGQTAATTAAVLGWYFCGLGLGAAAGRGIASRAVRVYGWLEIGAAAGALWSLAVFRLMGGEGTARWLAAGGGAGGQALLGLAVLPSTLCLGATLPALGQALAATGTAGRRGGLLYALNTLGGAAGIAAAGFGLPAAIGVRASYFAAAATGALAGSLALLAGRGLEPPPEITGPPAADGEPAVSRGRLRLVAAGAGALGLGLEIFWMRLFAQVLHNSVYSFSAVLLIFLVAISAGASAGALLLRRMAASLLAAGALLAAAFATIAGLWAFVTLTGGLAYLGMESGLGEYLLRIVALAAVSAGPAAFASGALLPALWAAWGDAGGAARPLGDLSAANTFGGIGGAVLGGFLSLPALGLRGSFLVAAIAYVVLADIVAPRRGRWRPLGYAALLAAAVADPLRAPLVHLRGTGEELRATAEGPSGIVSVVDTDGDLQLRLDNYYVLGGTAAALNERRLGLVPLLLHPQPRRVLFVGLATGISAGAAAALGIDSTTVVELVPEVADCARKYFSKWNGDLFERPGVRVVIGDGRRYLAASGDEFDVIISDLFIPWHAGAGSLYAQEMYRLVARRLAPDGLFCQWLPLYQLTREEFDVIARTLFSVFPQVDLWRADFYPNRPVLGLLTQRAPRAVDLDRVHERIGRLPAWSRDPLLASPRSFAMLYAGDATAAADLFPGSVLNTDDRPVIEFTAPRLTRIGAAGDKDWFTGERLAAFYDQLEEHFAGAHPSRAPDPIALASGGSRSARRAGIALFKYALASSRGEAHRAAGFEAEVRALVPEVIAAAEGKDEPATAEDARRGLEDLRVQEEEVRRQLERLERRLEEAGKGGEKP